MAVWPTPASSVRYLTPGAAALGFATDYLHMVNPVIGPFQETGSLSGQVPVAPNAIGPETKVLVRRLGSDNSWWVLGAKTDTIQLTEPVGNATVTSPVTLVGAAMAFEGTVRTEVREDDNANPIGTGTVTGRGDAMGPFRGSLAFTKATSKYGAIVLYTVSAKDGSVVVASVTRVRFG